MFDFFFNLSLAVYLGSWQNLNHNQILGLLDDYLPSWFTYFGTILSDSGSTFIYSNSTYQFAIPIVFVVCTICCISFFFIIVKAVKKLFTCFLDF